MRHGHKKNIKIADQAYQDRMIPAILKQWRWWTKHKKKIQVANMIMSRQKQFEMRQIYFAAYLRVYSISVKAREFRKRQL